MGTANFANLKRLRQSCLMWDEMTNTLFCAVIGVLVLGGVVALVLIAYRRNRRDYREHLEPVLTAQGYRFLSAKRPGLFNVGPFPKIEFKIGRPTSDVLGVSGEHNEYRVVKFRDAEGTVYELWAKLEFELFHLRRIRWRAGNDQGLPAKARSLLEN
jgi:hypothetical protein